MAWQCKNWGALPINGGMLDQPDQLIYRMGALDNIYRAVARMQNMAGKEIHNMTVQERQIVKWLQEEGIM